MHGVCVCACPVSDELAPSLLCLIRKFSHQKWRKRLPSTTMSPNVDCWTHEESAIVIPSVAAAPSNRPWLLLMLLGQRG